MKAGTQADRRHVRPAHRSSGRSHACDPGNAAAERSLRSPRSPFADLITPPAPAIRPAASAFSPAVPRTPQPTSRRAPSRFLSTLTRRAYRRPVTDADCPTSAHVLRQRARKQRDFDLGIQTALERLLVSPQFLYRIERDPAGAAPGARLSPSAISNWPRGFPSSCGAAFRTTSC